MCVQQLPDGVQLQNLEGGVFLLRLEPTERRIEWEKDEELISYLKEDGDPYVVDLARGHVHASCVQR